MTDPSRRTRLLTWLGRPFGKGRLNPAAVGALVVGLALVAALALWANALTAPVHRAGRPTASVPPLPERTAATPTPSATPTGGPTGGPTSATGADWPKVRASGKFDTAAAKVPAAGSAGRLRRFAVRVETSAKLDADEVGRQVAGVLNDPRSWAGSGNVRFALIDDPERAGFTITIAAPATAKKLCDPEPSTCLDSGDLVIDAARWRGLPPEYSSHDAWQAYLVNHAVGHLLGEAHEGCGKSGRPAPAMMAQEAAGLDGCTPNPWPFP